MTENGNVPRNLLRGLPPKPTTQNYAIDTDDIKSGVPEFPNLTQTRIAREEEIYAKPTNETGEYEAPMSRLTRFDNIRRGEENAPRGRPTTNNIYETTSEMQLRGKRNSGYSYAYTSNADELTSYEHPTQNFAYDNPLRAMADEEGNQAPTTRPRSRANDVYGSTTSDQSGYTVMGVRDIFNGIGKRRRNRWSACVWFALILSCVALLLSGISLHQAFTIRKRVLTDSNESDAITQKQFSERPEIKALEKQVFSLQRDSSELLAKYNETKIQVFSLQRDSSKLLAKYNKTKIQFFSLQRNFSELLAKYNETKNQTSAISLDISEKVQTYFDDIREKVDESDVRFKKTNISIWDKLATMRGPRGYNGTQGNTGPQGLPGIQGLPGPRGLTIKGCWYKSISRNGSNAEPKVAVFMKNTTTELYYGMTCKTSLADQTLIVIKANSDGYRCTCKNLRPMIFLTCTINCIYCTFLSTTV